MAAARVGGVDGDAPAVASQTCRPIPILVSAAPPSGAGGKRRRHLVPPPALCLGPGFDGGETRRKRPPLDLAQRSRRCS